MKNHKASLLTALFMAMLLSILYFITLGTPEAWAWYGWIFGILGVVYFTLCLYSWIAR